MYWIKEMQNAIGFIEDNLTEEIMTAGSAGGLFCPYKGLVLAALDSALN
jgi:hypothetical protein